MRPPDRPGLRAELLRRAEQDQAARTAPQGGARTARQGAQAAQRAQETEPDWDAVAAVDAANVGWLRDVVAEAGWPGRSLVGEDGAHAAWLLAQHADRDPAFQRSCLNLIAQAARDGEATLAELAYLTDRVLLAEGQPQEYGTQMEGRREGWTPRRLRDPGNVDERRAAMSLGPMSEYTARMADAYGPPRPAAIACHQCGRDIEVWLPEEGEARHLQCASCGWTTTVTVGEDEDA
jgi:uncharacterized protein DUF6624